jgi:hypothetical protein
LEVEKIERMKIGTWREVEQGPTAFDQKQEFKR